LLNEILQEATNQTGPSDKEVGTLFLTVRSTTNLPQDENNYLVNQNFIFFITLAWLYELSNWHFGLNLQSSLRQEISDQFWYSVHLYQSRLCHTLDISCPSFLYRRDKLC